MQAMTLKSRMEQLYIGQLTTERSKLSRNVLKGEQVCYDNCSIFLCSKRDGCILRYFATFNGLAYLWKIMSST